MIRFAITKRSAFSRVILAAGLALAAIAMVTRPAPAQWRGIDPVTPAWVTYSGGSGVAADPVIMEGARDVNDVLTAARAWIADYRQGWQPGAWHVVQRDSTPLLFIVDLSRSGERSSRVHFLLRNFNLMGEI